MIITRQSNAQGIFLVLSFIAMILIAWYAMLKPFAIIYSKFRSEDLGDARVYEIMDFTRYVWLIIPIILIVGLIIWLISISTKRDPQQYFLR